MNKVEHHGNKVKLTPLSKLPTMNGWILTCVVWGISVELASVMSCDS